MALDLNLRSKEKIKIASCNETLRSDFYLNTLWAC